jgi:hypothetical protein
MYPDDVSVADTTAFWQFIGPATVTWCATDSPASPETTSPAGEEMTTAPEKVDAPVTSNGPVICAAVEMYAVPKAPIVNHPVFAPMFPIVTVPF